MQFLSVSSPRVLASRPRFLTMENQTSICCLGPASGLEQKIEFVFSCQSRNNQREHPELALLRPVGLTARPGRRRAEEILLVHRRALRSDAATCFHHLKSSLPPVDRHEVGHQLARYGERRAIGVAFCFSVS